MLQRLILWVRWEHQGSLVARLLRSVLSGLGLQLDGNRTDDFIRY